MHWHTKAGNIATNIKVQVDFTLRLLSSMNVMTWKFHVDDSTKGRYGMILGRYLLTGLGLNLKFSNHKIEEDDCPLKGFTTPMVDLCAY